MVNQIATIMPAQIADLIQTGALERAFHDSLFPTIQFRAEAISEEFPPAAGTEILMTSTVKGRDDASYRHDFPGGWAGDQVNAFTGAVIEFEVFGQVSGVGAFSFVAKRVVTQGSVGTTPALTTVGTDVSTANTPDIQIDGTANQTVTLKARLGGSGTNVIGTAVMKLDGIASRVWKL